MGRYYNGDISGKFGFASQSSSDGEYFGAVQSNYVPYVIYNDSIPEAIESLKELIKEYKKETKNKKLTINTTSDDFWQMVDTDWYQKKENGLLSSRISMGLEIVQFNKKYPDDDISFTAEF